MNGSLEFEEDLLDTFSESFTLGSSEFNFFEFVEFNDGFSEMKNVVGSFEETV